MKKCKFRAEKAAQERILDTLLSKPKEDWDNENKDDPTTRQVFLKKLSEGQLDYKEIQIDVSASQVGIEIMSTLGM